MEGLKDTNNSLLPRCVGMRCPFVGYVILQWKIGMIGYLSDPGARTLLYQLGHCLLGFGDIARFKDSRPRDLACQAVESNS
jgi:hypothetical protein